MLSNYETLEPANLHPDTFKSVRMEVVDYQQTLSGGRGYFVRICPALQAVASQRQTVCATQRRLSICDVGPYHVSDVRIGRKDFLHSCREPSELWCGVDLLEKLLHDWPGWIRKA
jgi:hypothetical protein